MRAIITGDAGFIGSRLTKRRLDDGHASATEGWFKHLERSPS